MKNIEQAVVISIKSKKAPGEKKFRLHKKRIVLGSSTSSDVRLDDALVSPIHAILEVSGVDGKPVVYDLASDSGIQVNGKKEVQATLELKDTLQIGPYFITVELQHLEQVPEPVPVSREELAPLILEAQEDVHEIFDPVPVGKISLQVVMFYNDTIVDVEHFTRGQNVVIGPGKKEDFSIPPFFGEGRYGRFELVSSQGGQYVLQIHDSMTGVVSQGGKLTKLEKGVAQKVLPLMEKDFAKVKIGDVSFFMNYTPAPPKLKPSKLLERDPLFVKIWFASLLFTVAALLGISRIHVDPKIEIEQLPERVATIIYEPKLVPIEKPPVPKVVEKKPEPPVPAPPKAPPKKVVLDVKPAPVKAPPAKEIAPKEHQAPAKHASPKPKPKAAPKPQAQAKNASGNQGEGARAKGTEGMRGKPNAPKSTTPQDKALRPGPTKPVATKPVASAPGNSQTNSLGVVDVFRENKGTLNKILAGGKGAANSIDRLEGYSGFTTEGKGGLGAAGAEKGGGGQSMGLGGLSDKGIGGGKKGSGLGALGSGGSILGGKGNLNVQSGGVSEPVVLGGIDEDAIRRAVERHRDEIKYCYEKEINAERPDIAGRIGVRWVIGASGTVTSAGVSSSSIRNANIERCVVDVIRRIQFPPVRGGGIAEVTYPFVFKPSNR